MTGNCPVRPSCTICTSPGRLANMPIVSKNVSPDRRVQTVVFHSPTRLRSIVACQFSHGEPQSICIPSSVTSLDDKCFWGCWFLRTVEFEPVSQLIEIGDGAFSGCSSLQSISIPCSVEVIGPSAFSGCRSLQSCHFEFPSHVRELRFGAFLNCCSLRSISIPCCVESIGIACFERCESLSSVILQSGSGLATLGLRAFLGCSALRSFVIPSLVREISGCCFAECRRLSMLVFESPSHVESFTLSIPSNFSGNQLELPNSIRFVELKIACRVNLALKFERDSALSELRIESYSDLHRRCNLNRNVFVRLSERTVKSLRLSCS
jgi:hypothetical protein